jgi:hypothetical protein
LGVRISSGALRGRGWLPYSGHGDSHPDLRSANKPILISHENGIVTRSQVSGGINGWFQ